MARKSIDCRDFPDETGCTLYLSGEEEEVVRAAAQHAADVHGHPDTPEMREWFHSNLKDETAPTHA
jgi:predicted small metal-binding protein